VRLGYPLPPYSSQILGRLAAHFALATLGVSCAAGLLGCHPHSREIVSSSAVESDLPEPLKSELSASEKPSPDRVLHASQAASLAIWYGDASLAGRELDVAIAEIETLYTGTDSDAAEARRLYHEEREKPFKGEPYERLMVYLYRGLLDYGAGDYSNAAASFRSAILQDAFADEQQNQCDFEVVEYMLARAVMRSGGDQHLVNDAFERARALGTIHKTTVPTLKPTDNVLLFVEVGPSPFKVGQGESDELLVVGRRAKDGMHALVSVDHGEQFRTEETGNLAFQAMTRGGRQFDFLLAGKAYTKQLSQQSGLTINQIGTALSFTVPVVGAPIQLAGLIVTASGIGIKPQADTRYWKALPDSIHIIPLQLSVGHHQVRIQFRNQFDKHLVSKDQRFSIDVGDQTRELLIWASWGDLWPGRNLFFAS